MAVLEDEILKTHSMRVSEDNKKFLIDTRSQEMLIVVLKSHLYIERELINMLTETIVDERVLKGTTFKQKLQLAYSMGMLDDNYGAVNKVNTIRNQYAHDIDYEFNEKEFEDLLSTLSKEAKADYWEDYKYWGPVLYDKSISEFNFRAQLLFNNIWFGMTTCRAFAKKAIELKLHEKEIEKAIKIRTENNN